MSVYLQTYTLNCGNDSPGQNSIFHLIAQIQNDAINCALLHCQEAPQKKTIALLLKALEGSNWELSIGGFMPTHTKFSTQWHHQTGLLTLAIHRKDITVNWDTNTRQKVRRKTHRYQPGYNKGGLIERLEIETSGQRFQVLSINGHLDSDSLYKRYRDWYNLHKHLWPDIQNWEALAAFVPDTIVAGFDSNSRNTLHGHGKSTVSVNAWNDSKIGETKVFSPTLFRQSASLYFRLTFRAISKEFVSS